MILTKFQDKPLSGLLMGMVIMKLLRGEFNIPRSISRPLKAVKIGFLIIKILEKNSTEGEFLGERSR